MPTSVDIKNLKINKLTEAQYDTAVQGGIIGENELSVLTDLTDEIQVETMPTASASNEGQIVQYIGATDSTYTNAYFYKCVSDGQVPATYSWTQVEVQPAGSSLPDQTGQSGKFLTTDGTDASWSDTLAGDLKILTGGKKIFLASSTNNTSNITADQYYGGGLAFSVGNFDNTQKTNYLLQKAGFSPELNGYQDLGQQTKRWNKIFVKKMQSANASGDSYAITVPEVGGTMAVITVNTTVTLAAADWSSNSQTVNVTGMSASALVFVAPAVASQSDYTSAGIICSAQGSGTLTFTCDTTPTNDITVNVVAL